VIGTEGLASSNPRMLAEAEIRRLMGFDIYEMCVNMIPGWTKVGVPTIGKCKGTLDALMKCDMIMIFHVPLFAKWLREV
jgi:2,5-dihydroxypyridine 5,6-dioxygenase